MSVRIIYISFVNTEYNNNNINNNPRVRDVAAVGHVHAGSSKNENHAVTVFVLGIGAGGLIMLKTYILFPMMSI